MRLPLDLAVLLVAAAQSEDAVACGLLRLEVIVSHEDGSDWADAARAVSYSAAVRNVAPASLTIRGRFAGPGVTRDGLVGRTWKLAPGRRAHLPLGAGPGPAMTDAEVRECLLLTCS